MKHGVKQQYPPEEQQYPPKTNAVEKAQKATKDTTTKDSTRKRDSQAQNKRIKNSSLSAQDSLQDEVAYVLTTASLLKETQNVVQAGRLKCIIRSTFKQFHLRLLNGSVWKGQVVRR